MAQNRVEMLLENPKVVVENNENFDLFLSMIWETGFMSCKSEQAFNRLRFIEGSIAGSPIERVYNLYRMGQTVRNSNDSILRKGNFLHFDNLVKLYNVNFPLPEGIFEKWREFIDKLRSQYVDNLNAVISWIQNLAVQSGSAPYFKNLALAYKDNVAEPVIRLPDSALQEGLADNIIAYLDKLANCYHIHRTYWKMFSKPISGAETAVRAMFSNIGEFGYGVKFDEANSVQKSVLILDNRSDFGAKCLVFRSFAEAGFSEREFAKYSWSHVIHAMVRYLILNGLGKIVHQEASFKVIPNAPNILDEICRLARSDKDFIYSKNGSKGLNISLTMDFGSVEALGFGSKSAAKMYVSSVVLIEAVKLLLNSTKNYTGLECSYVIGIDAEKQLTSPLDAEKLWGPFRQ